MDTQHSTKVAMEIADALGEAGGPGQAPRERVERQLVRMLGLMGEDWVRDALRSTQVIYPVEEPRVGGRTFGGSFFATARDSAYRMTQKGEIDRQTFFSTFCWRERKPRAPKPVPAPKPKRERRPPAPRAPAPARAWGQGVRRNRPVVPEVYQARRAAR